MKPFILSGTMFEESRMLGDKLTEMGKAAKGKLIVGQYQSSDRSFHCLAYVGIDLGPVDNQQGIEFGDVTDPGPWQEVRTFRATKAKERALLADEIAKWVEGHSWGYAAITLSSDDEFHCLTITVGKDRVYDFVDGKPS